MKSKKLLSLLLALMMMLSVVPMYASAAEPITLTYTNIAIVPPSVSPDEMAYGDTWSVLTITGGELYYIAEDGTETLVPGHFEHYRADGIPAEGDNRAVPFNFVSEDTTKFASIQRLQSGRVTVKSGTWPTINVVAGRVRPTITEAPIVVDAVPGMLWGDVTLTGGKAVYEGEEVEGSFIVYKESSNSKVSYGTAKIAVQFIPTDTSKYLSSGIARYDFTVKQPIKFVDSNGTETIPEITLPYGLKMSDDIGNYLKSYLNTSASFNFTETQYYNEYVPVGTHDLTVIASCNDSNYESPAVLPFKLTVEPVETAVTVKYDINKDNKNTYELYVVKADVDGARPQGTFALYVDGQLIKDGVKYSEHITWSPEKSKAYAVKVVYTPTANDSCIVADTEITVDAKLYRKVTTLGTSADGTKEFRCGEKIQVTANVPEFSGWVITDTAGNEVNLGVDLTAKSIEFAVPDFDINLEAKGKTSSGTTGGGIFDMDFGSLTEGDSEWAIINIIRNLIAMFKSFLQQLIETFRGIGD